MKRTLLILLFFCASCAPDSISVPTANRAPSATLPAPTATIIPASPTQLPTETPIPCDPRVANYCITDGHFLFERPIRPPANDSVEETYRYASTAAGTRDPHHGVEFVNRTGVPVQAAASGQVIFAGPDEEAVYSPWKNFYGNVVVIRHADDLYTLYAHLSVMDVQAGQEILAGEKIGEVGLTGSATGSHLHFEVRRGDVEDYFSTLNPELWLRPRAGEGALAISVMNAQGGYQQVELVIQTEGKNHFIGTYPADFLPTEENAALGGLTAGRYRITLMVDGKIYERWVVVDSGKLTVIFMAIE